MCRVSFGCKRAVRFMSGSPPEAEIVRRLGQPSMADSPRAAIHGRCGQSPLRAAPFLCACPCFGCCSNSRSMEFHDAKATGLSGVCTERAEHWRSRRRGSGRALWRLKNERMRAPACGSGADVQAAGHTPGRPVAPAWGDAFLLLGNQTTAKSLDPCFRRDDGKSNSNVGGRNCCAALREDAMPTSATTAAARSPGQAALAAPPAPDHDPRDR